MHPCTGICSRTHLTPENRTPENNRSNEAIKHHQVVTSTLQSQGRGFTPFLFFPGNLRVDDAASRLRVWLFYNRLGIYSHVSRPGRLKILLFRNHLILIMTLFWALPPPLWHPPVAIVPYYLYAIGEKFSVQVIPRHHNAPPSPMGAGLAQGGAIIT